MKKFFIGIAALALIAGCKKGELTGKDNPLYNTPIQLALDGPDSVTINQLETVEIPYTLRHVAGTRVPVSITISGMPANLVASFQTPIDSPTYTSNLRFVATNADTGFYQLTVTTASIDTTQTFPISLHIIVPPVNDALALAGNYIEQGPCTASGNLNNSANITTVSGTINTIRILGIWGGGVQYAVTANLDPATSTINIPLQSFGSGTLTISGTGTYTTATAHLSVAYHVTDGNLVDEDCTTEFSK